MREVGFPPDNALFYCRNHVPFVMGTTGGDREKLMNDVRESGNYAVIAPQMGKQVLPHASMLHRNWTTAVEIVCKKVFLDPQST